MGSIEQQVDLGTNPDRDPKRLTRYKEIVGVELEEIFEGYKERNDADLLRAEVDQLRSHIRPSEPYDVTEYGEQLKADFCSSQTKGVEAVVEDAKGENRPSYYGVEEEGPSIVVSKIGVYNSPPNNNERQTVSLNLDWENNWEAVHVYCELLRDALRKNDVVCVLPFNSEAGIAYKNVEYAVKTLGVENVIASSTGRNSNAEDEVIRALRGQDDRFVRQTDYLSQVINWREARDCYGIPLLEGEDPALPPKLGRKGITMLAGVLRLMEYDQLSRSRVVFHDTDITNPDNYKALEWLAIPLLDPPCVDDYVHSVYVAKTGPGRNNETQTIAAAVIDNSLQDLLLYYDVLDLDPKANQLLRQYSTLIWMLTGERMISGELLKQMPWSSGMTIETTINLYLLGMQIDKERLHVCQVLNPQRKVECAPAAHEREMSMMQECALWLQKNVLYTALYSKFLHEYTEDDIVTINKRAGVPKTARMQNYRHQPNSTITIAQDCMFGSIADMEKKGILKF